MRRAVDVNLPHRLRGPNRRDERLPFLLALGEPRDDGRQGRGRPARPPP